MRIQSSLFFFLFSLFRNTLKEELNANECHSQLNSSRLINHTIEEGEKSLSSTPRKNPAIDLIDKLILLSPSPIKEPAAGATGSQTKVFILFPPTFQIYHVNNFICLFFRILIHKQLLLKIESPI